MNQMLQDSSELQDSSGLQESPERQQSPDLKQPSGVAGGPEIPEPPPVRVHPRFAKPQRVAFVQSAWHREVVEECRLAFLGEIEARGIARAQIDLFEVPG